MKIKALVFAALGALCFAPTASAWTLDQDVSCQAQSNELVIVTGGQRVPMRSITAQVRTAARAMGFGGVAQYAVLMGNRAMYRITDHQPKFLLTVPGNVQPQGLFTLARFEPRPNGSREVLIGGGFMSYSTGVAPERSVALNVQIAASQAGAPAGSTIYELTPQVALGSGEYAMIVAVSAQNAGPMGATAMGTYYDFGVD
jgi:hypothetical protein